jgi:hypothetical protein
VVDGVSGYLRQSLAVCRKVEDIITLIVILMLGIKHVIILILVVCALLYAGYVEFLIVEFNDVISSIITV